MRARFVREERPLSTLARALFISKCSILGYNLHWMEPNFQSSFIPKGSAVSPIASPIGGRSIKASGRDILSFLAMLIFAGSFILAAGAFLYKIFLNYRIEQMSAELENARGALASDAVTELIRLNNRIVSTDELINRHRVLSPLLEFLESSTLKTVRFTGFNFFESEKGLELSLKGEARGYAALALQADLINKSAYFRNPVFSDISLDEKGNVVFSLKTIVDPELLSYQRSIQGVQNIPTELQLSPAATSTATSTATGTPSRTGSQQISTSSPQTQN